MQRGSRDTSRAQEHLVGGTRGNTTREDTKEDVVIKLMHHLLPDRGSSLALVLSVASMAMSWDTVLSSSEQLHRL